MLKRMLLLVAAVALIALAGAAHAAGADLELKCKAVELYLNSTGTPAALPCDQLLKEVRVANSAKPVLPMVGVGELKRAGASDPKLVFDALRAARASALVNLDIHVDKARRIILRELNATSLDGAYVATERAMRELSYLRSLLARAGASPIALAAVKRNVDAVNSTCQLLLTLRQGDAWAVRAAGNASDVEMSRALRQLALLRREWNATLSWLKENNIAWYRQAKDAVDKWFSRTNSTLIDIWIAAKVNREATVRYLRAGNLVAIRNLADIARRDVPGLAEKIAEIARELAKP